MGTEKFEFDARLLSLKPESGLFTFDRVNLALTWDKGRDSCTFNQLLTHFTNFKVSKTKILKKNVESTESRTDLQRIRRGRY